MTRLPPIDPAGFIAVMQPLLEANDLKGIVSAIKEKWTHEQLVGLLNGPCDDARKVAALALGLVGKKSCLPELAQLLEDEDPVLNNVVEHALWSIWFRSGTCDANRALARGSEAVGQRDFDRAIEHFTKAIELDPDFAEAYNQRAIVEYLRENYQASIADCQRAVHRMPFHFGAWAGIGHCYAHLGRHQEAIEAYEHAIELNPHLDCVQQALSALRREEKT